MSVPVELAELEQRLEEYGPVAFLVTVAGDRRPHVVSVVVDLIDAALVAGAGRTTATNVEAHPEVTLLWPAASGGDYCLIVDGHARVSDGSTPQVTVEPARAVLHRVADAEGSGPSCVTVLDRRRTPPTG